MRYNVNIVHNQNVFKLINVCVVIYFLHKTGTKFYQGIRLGNDGLIDINNSVHCTVKIISKVPSSIVILETARKKYDWSKLTY